MAHGSSKQEPMPRRRRLWEIVPPSTPPRRPQSTPDLNTPPHDRDDVGDHPPLRERPEIVQLEIGPTGSLDRSHRLHRALHFYQDNSPTQIRIYRVGWFRMLVVAYDVAFNKLFRVTWDGDTLREVFPWEHTKYMF